MLIWLLDWLQSGAAAHAPSPDRPVLRATLAGLVGLGLALTLGPRLIAWLAAHCREPIVSASPQLEMLHQHKRHTPTMGGVLLVAGAFAGLLLFADLQQPYLHAALLLGAASAALGGIDDLAKLASRRHGLSIRAKLAAQTVVATAVAVVVYRLHAPTPGTLDITLPLFGNTFHLGWMFVPLAVLVLVGASNAVNLTDGLDGLAGGCLIFAILGMGVVAYVSGHAELAPSAGVPYVPGAGEMTVLAGSLLGGLLGILWFNCHPAQVFMGDTGALPLGSLLGLVAIVARQELLLIVIGGVFVAEAASVLVQVSCFRWTRRRVLRCAPLHHHFQFRGWPENRIVVRFWIASALCATVGVAGMKHSARNSPHPPQHLSRPDTIPLSMPLGSGARVSEVKHAQTRR